MKTTIDLPDQLVEQLKIRCVRERRKLKDLAAEVIRRGLETAPVKVKRHAGFGCGKGAGFYMAPDFDAPLEDFKGYQ